LQKPAQRASICPDRQTDRKKMLPRASSPNKTKQKSKNPKKTGKTIQNK